MPLYDNSGGFSNGYVPLFGVIGRDYKVYYNDNDRNFDVQLKLAMNEMFDSGAPGAPTDFTSTLNNNNSFNVDLSWKNPSITFSGEPLTSLTAVKLYRNETLITSFDSPEMGEEKEYMDSSIPESGLYTYKIVGVNEAGEGLPTKTSIYVGEDVPGMVNNLTLVNNEGIAELSWENPTVGANGGLYIYDSIISYSITRNDGQEFTLEGMATSFSDNTIPLSSNYNYTVVAVNNIGAGLEAVSNTVSFITGNTLVFEGFENFPPEGWIVKGNNWRHGYSSNAGGSSPEAEFYWNPATVGEQYLIVKPLDTSGKSSVFLSFDHMINYYGPGYDCKIVTSTDSVNWEVVHTFDNTQNIGPESFFMEISNNHVGSSSLYIAFQFSGDSYQINNWSIDNVSISFSSGISTNELNMVKGFYLSQNYPNPFNPKTSINFKISDDSSVKLQIFNSNGEIINTLIDRDMGSGYHSVEFNAESLNSGVYFYKLSVNGFSETKKMILVK
ncbi:MAG: hypothetical protein CR982_07000 [Candidatus Cloacimonadota bacterium]|nr:MAG: hypothetical protein CR982_07000 [Candidatus Cloacimonadota bacterium]PIE80654.1 MAG: hypothetical protein CSA15_01765 [Candidatus Delongbacteria bacterium]